MDLDGTLIDTDPLHLEAFRRLLAPHGRSMDEEYYTTNVMGSSNDAIMSALFPEADAAERRALGERKEVLFREQLTGPLDPKRGLGAFLAFARENGFGIAVVTNAPRDNATMMLDGLGVSDLMDHVLIGDELPRSKPDPYPYAEAARRLGVDMSRALAFEDSGPGIRSASSAGAYTFALESALGRERALASGASEVIADFAAPALWRKIEALTGREIVR
ncbi:haloacid dehalogenase [Salinarimonas ramus]|uniref:Haloacid dehalogenase n=2 Tax=Salinarimonas ramus TaxID=690164 RepID=A0A917QAN0_9HYPH|nr:haloacid dehalogenase [Salinarimonas ramus]